MQYLRGICNIRVIFLSFVTVKSPYVTHFYRSLGDISLFTVVICRGGAAMFNLPLEGKGDREAVDEVCGMH